MHQVSIQLLVIAIAALGVHCFVYQVALYLVLLLTHVLEVHLTSEGHCLFEKIELLVLVCELVQLLKANDALD